MNALIALALLPMIQAGPVRVPAGKTLLMSWSASPTGAGSAQVRDGWDDEAENPTYGYANDKWPGSFMLSDGFAGPQLVLNVPATPQSATFQITVSGQFPGPAAGWELSGATASPFSATFTATAPNQGGWGGPVTVTFTELP